MFILFLLIILLFPLPAHAQPDPLIGYWQTQEKDGIIEFFPCEDKFCGRFVWLKGDSAETPSLDENNPDPQKRHRPMCGMMFIGDFERIGKEYKNGWLYSPRHGSRFNAEMQIDNDNYLLMRGYFLLPLLGNTQVWTRIEKPEYCWALQMPKQILH